MSTLWTPGGEVPINRRPFDDATRTTAADADSAADHPDLNLDDLSAEERAQAEQFVRDLAESRERLRSTPAETVVCNHAMGLYELAAIHLAAQPPSFSEATVAIDALGVLLDGMKGRLGDAEPTLRDAASQIRMAFVQLKNRLPDGADSDADADAVTASGARD